MPTRIALSMVLLVLGPGIERAAAQDASRRALAARCGSEIDWSRSWEASAEKARREGKLVVAYLRRYGGFQLSDASRSGPFMDRDLIDLLGTCFVTWRCERGDSAPFVAAEVHGLGPHTFGQAILVAAPSGRVVGETHTLEPRALEEFLLRMLPEEDPGETIRVRSGGAEERRSRAESAMKRGAFSRAEALLADDASWSAHRLRGTLCRRRRQGEEALAHLARARQDAPNAALPDLGMEEARVLLGMGRHEDAAKQLAIFVADTRSPHHGEAAYLHGALQLGAGNPAAAATRWKGLIAHHPESRWAWKAAAMLESTGFGLGIGERLAWPTEEQLAAVRRVDSEVLPVSEMARIRSEAMRFLLEHQTADGAWLCAADVGTLASRELSDFTRGVTALGAMALVPHRSDAAVAAALDLAVAFLLADHERTLRHPPKQYFMDYSMWSQATLLWLLAELRESGFDDGDRTRQVMARLVRGLARTQRCAGGWSYYLHQDLGAEPSDRPISFVTAAVVLALLRARDAGTVVPPRMIDEALKCLLAMRAPNGAWAYMGTDRTSLLSTTEAAGAGRAPLCALALHRGGVATQEDLGQALRHFETHRASYASERRKALMHTGADAQGSHYLMFDYALAAKAVGAFSGQGRSRHREGVIEDVLAARQRDGSFLGTPLLGSNYGTAMALLAIDA